jgi:hypothetical protein
MKAKRKYDNRFDSAFDIFVKFKNWILYVMYYRYLVLIGALSVRII